MADLTISDIAPPSPYRFAPPDSLAVTPADQVLIAACAVTTGARKLRRAWRTSPTTAPTWVYIVQVTPGTDELRVYSTLSTKLTASGSPHPVEVVPEGEPVPPYQAAALAASRRIWPAS